MSELPAATATLPIRQALPTDEFRAVVYRVDSFLFATEVKLVQEIIRPSRMVRLATLPGYVDGVIKRRGRIVPMVNLRKRLGLPEAAPTPETCAVIVKLSVGPVGFVADAALELRRFQPSTMEPPSAILARVDQVYIQAVAQSGTDTLVMVDLQRLLTPTEQLELIGIGNA